MGAGAEPVSGNDRRAGIRAKRIEHFWNVEQWEKTQQTCTENTSWHPYENGKINEAAFCERNIIVITV